MLLVVDPAEGGHRAASRHKEELLGALALTEGNVHNGENFMLLTFSLGPEISNTSSSSFIWQMSLFILLKHD